MIANELRELLHRDPFVPFRVRETSGKAIVVRNPDLAVLMRSQLLVAAAGSDRYTIVPFLHIAGIDVLGNGGRQPPTRRRG